jgi:GH25 family lysozyme M1 (1,4-beta-N-acetylmuramidase)
MAMILGIDVCHWDTNINWGTLKSSGVEFVFIKATQGNYLTDPMLNKYCADANKAGLIVGLYHWCDPIVSASSQAAYFLKAISGLTYHMISLDVEQQWADWSEWSKHKITKVFSSNQISENGRLIAAAVKSAIKTPAAVYTSSWFINEYAPTAVNWLKDYPLWLAHYPYKSGRISTTWDSFKTTNKPTIAAPSMPKGITQWTFWQFTGDKFILPGADSALDVNYYNGTLDELKKMLGIKTETETRPAPPTTEERVTTLEGRVTKLENAAKKQGWTL